MRTGSANDPGRTAADDAGHRMLSERAESSVPVLVVGDCAAGVAVVKSLLRDRDAVLFLDSQPKAVESVSELGCPAEVVDITSGEALRQACADVDGIELAVVAVESDATAFLVGQLSKTKLDAETVIVLMSEPENRVAFERAGMIPVCATTATADAIVGTRSLVRRVDSNRSPASTVSERVNDDSEPRRRA